MKIYQMVLGPISTNCYLLADDSGNTAVIDPAAQAEEIVRHMKRLELTPAVILLTHGHPDHIGGVKGLKEAFPELPVVIGAPDACRLTDENRRRMWSAEFDPRDYEGISADRTVTDGDVVEAGGLVFDVIATPGHTQGGVCYRCGEYLFTGDTLFCGDVGRTDLEGGDFKQLQKSLRRLAELEGDYAVLPGHGGASSLEDERRRNYYIREALQ